MNVFVWVYFAIQKSYKTQQITYYFSSTILFLNILGRIDKLYVKTLEHLKQTFEGGVWE